MAGELGRPVTQATARRELVTLSAAMSFAYKERKLSQPIHVPLPADSEPRRVWLRRSQAAALLAGTLGFRTEYDKGKPVKRTRVARPSYHIARFVLIGLRRGDSWVRTTSIRDL